MSDWASTASRFPFTITMLCVLISAGIYGRSHVGLLDEDLHRQAGYSMRLIFQGEIHRVVTSLLFTAGGWRFYGSIAMFALAVGYAEWNQGTTRSAATFFGIHFATLAVMVFAVAAWTFATDSHRGSLLWEVQDVGPSAGYYGCFGLALAGMSPQLRTTMIATTLTILAMRATWSWIQLPEEGRMLSADLAHLIAFPLGILSSRFWNA